MARPYPIISSGAVAIEKRSEAHQLLLHLIPQHTCLAHLPVQKQGAAPSLTWATCKYTHMIVAHHTYITFSLAQGQNMSVRDKTQLMLMPVSWNIILLVIKHYEWKLFWWKWTWGSKLPIKPQTGCYAGCCVNTVKTHSKLPDLHSVVYTVSVQHAQAPHIRAGDNSGDMTISSTHRLCSLYSSFCLTHRVGFILHTISHEWHNLLDLILFVEALWTVFLVWKVKYK